MRGAASLRNDGEAGDVVALVFDVLGEHRQAVVHAGLGAGDGGGSRIAFALPSGGIGGAGDFMQARLRHVLASQLRHCESGCGLL